MDLRKKRIQAVIVVIIAAIIALIGSFAWFSFNQRATNEFEIKTPPDVNLHDDFDGGPQKDVFVENSGQRDVFVRVRLSEYMQIGANPLVPGAVKDDPDTWTAHAPNGKGECHICIDNPNHEWFHTYYEWTMGGRKFYRPAEDAARGYGDPLNPTGAGENGTPYKESDVVGDTTDYEALLRAAFAGDTATLALIDKFADYTQTFDGADYEALQAAIEGLKGTAADAVIWKEADHYDTQRVDPITGADIPYQEMYLSDIQLTKTGDPFKTVGDVAERQEGISPPMVITMEDWRNGTSYGTPFAKGDFWVIDTDGWAYWANPLKPGEATGTLLSWVDRTEKFPADDAYYAIDVWLQAVTADDLERFGMSANMDGGGGISNDGALLFKLTSGDYTYDGTAQKFFQNKGDNVYIEIDPTTFDPAAGAEFFIGGPDGKPEDGKNIAGATAISVYDGTAGVEEVKTMILTDLKLVQGVNGRWYIDLGDGSYAMTPVYGDGEDKDSMPQAPYEMAGLGVGYDDNHPFVRVWPDSSGNIGTRNDQYEQQYVQLNNGTGEWVHFLGDGVFVKTTWNAATGKYEDDLTAYYFNGENDSMNNIAGYADADAFPFSYKAGDLFRFEPGVGFDTARDPNTDDYTFQFAGMVQGTNGKWYIATEDVFTVAPYVGVENPQGENTLIKLNPDKSDGGVLGNANNVLVWAKNPGTDDQDSAMSEPFLKGVKKTDLLPGGDGFSVDGANWKVLDVDEFGNRLLLCDSLAGNKVTMGKSLYSQSNVRAEMQKIMATLPTINKYALPVETPVWYRQLTASGGTASRIDPSNYNAVYNYNDAELSSAKNIDGNWSTAGAEAFALSLSEAIKYADSIADCNDSWWLRSAGKITGCGTKLPIQVPGGTTSQKYQMTEPTASQICGTHDGLSFVRDYNGNQRDIHTMGAYTDSFRCRAAMWVRFSDADKVAAGIANGSITW